MRQNNAKRIGMLLSLVFMAVTAATSLSASDNRQAEGSPAGAKLKVLILPFHDVTDTNQYRNSQIIQSIYFRSLYTFIGIMPTLNVPQAAELVRLDADLPPALLSSNQGADIVIYGSVRLDGPRNNPQVKTELDIWDNVHQTNLLKADFKSTTGPDIFDSVDACIDQVMKSALNIEPGTGILQFAGFHTGQEQYDLLVNDRLIDTISNDDYSLNLKLLPDSDYRVLLMHRRDNRVVLDNTVKLRKYETKQISYSAFGTVNIGEVSFRKRSESYQLRLDDAPVSEGTVLTNIFAGKTHMLSLFRTSGTLVSSNCFYLGDSERKGFRLSESDYFPWHAVFLTMDCDFFTAGVQYFIDRYLWAEAGLGASFSKYSGTNLYFVSPYVSCGYYFWGDLSSDIRVAAGLTGRLNIYSPEALAYKINPDTSNYAVNPGLFMQAEWKWFVFRPELYFYYSAKQVHLTYGLGLGLRI